MTIMPKTAVAVGTLSAFNLSAVDSVPMHLMNVPVSTIFMAFLGVLLTLAWGDETSQMSKKKMYVSAALFTMLATTTVAVLPSMLGWEWYSVKLEGSLAFLIGAVGPYGVPLLRNLLPEIVRKWFRLEPKQEEKVNEDL